MATFFDPGVTCKSVSYLMIDKVRFQSVVLKYIQDNVPEFNTCCPEGWDFDEYRSMDPLMSYLLGGRSDPDNRRSFFLEESSFLEEDESLPLNDDQLSVNGQTWILKVTIDAYTPEYDEKVVEVPIPYSLLQNIKNTLFKDHKLIKIS